MSLDPLRKLAQEASPAPWREAIEPEYDTMNPLHGSVLSERGWVASPRWPYDRRFIAAARNTYEALLDCRDALEDLLKIQRYSAPEKLGGGWNDALIDQAKNALARLHEVNVTGEKEP